VILVVEREEKRSFGVDFSALVTAAAAGLGPAWPLFCLQVVELTALGADDQALHRLAVAFLGAGELQTFEGLRLPRRRREWLAGRLAVKEAVRTLAGQGAGARVEIGVASRGKPLLAGGGREAGTVHVAISHSGNSALGLAARGPCALDFQEIRPSLARVEARFARPEEARRIRPCHPDRLTALGLLWAAKEALRKYVDLWPLLGFLETRLVAVRPLAAGFLLSCEPVVATRELPAGLPPVMVMLHQGSALALILAHGGQAADGGADVFNDNKRR
jgi:phosphopantetheinyl transferase